MSAENTPAAERQIESVKIGVRVAWPHRHAVTVRAVLREWLRFLREVRSNA